MNHRLTDRGFPMRISHREWSAFPIHRSIYCPGKRKMIGYFLMSSIGRPETLQLQQDKRDEGGLEGLLRVCRVGAEDGWSGDMLPTSHKSLPTIH